MNEAVPKLIISDECDDRSFADAPMISTSSSSTLVGKKRSLNGDYSSNGQPIFYCNHCRKPCNRRTDLSCETEHCAAIYHEHCLEPAVAKVNRDYCDYKDNLGQDYCIMCPTCAQFDIEYCKLYEHVAVLKHNDRAIGCFVVCRIADDPPLPLPLPLPSENFKRIMRLDPSLNMTEAEKIEFLNLYLLRIGVSPKQGTRFVKLSNVRDLTVVRWLLDNQHVFDDVKITMGPIKCKRLLPPSPPSLPAEPRSSASEDRRGKSNRSAASHTSEPDTSQPRQSSSSSSSSSSFKRTGKSPAIRDDGGGFKPMASSFSVPKDLGGVPTKGKGVREMVDSSHLLRSTHAGQELWRAFCEQGYLLIRGCLDERQVRDCKGQLLKVMRQLGEVDSQGLSSSKRGSIVALNSGSIIYGAKQFADQNVCYQSIQPPSATTSSTPSTTTYHHLPPPTTPHHPTLIPFYGHHLAAANKTLDVLQPK